MYTVKLNNTIIHDPSQRILLGSGRYKDEENSIGSFSITIYPDNPGYEAISDMLTGLITLYQDGRFIYQGRIVELYQDDLNGLEVETESILSWLNDSIQRPAEYHGYSPRQYLSALIDIHNEQVGPDKSFAVGAVTVTDPNDSIYRYTNDETTWDVIQTDLIESLGGKLRLRIVNGVRYIDYLADCPRTSNQQIEFGENLLTFVKNTSGRDLATVCIPRGAKLEESTIEALEERLTIATVNDGKDYVQIDTAVNRYGVIQKVVVWDDVHTPSMLKSKAEAWLADNQYESVTIEVTAVDLADLGYDIEHFELLDRIICTSAPHGMNHSFPLTKVDIDITDPSKNTYTLGSSKKTFSSSVSSAYKTISSQVSSIPGKHRILEEARDNATAIINTMGRGGHVAFYPDAVTPEEILIMDTTDTETAANMWRWNLGGLGYSRNGYGGPFDTAITMDGHFVGEFLTVGSVSAEKLSVEYKNSVENRINLAQYDATDDAAEYTDSKLRDYYTISEIATKFDVIPGQISAAITEASEMFLNPSTQDKAYIESKLKNYWNQEQTQTAISVAINEINLSVENRLSEIRVGADNMLLHTDFSDWVFSNCTKTEVNDSEYGACIQVTATGDEGSSYIQGRCVQQVAPYVTGDYTMSIHAKSAMPTGSVLESVIGAAATVPLVDDDGCAIVAESVTDPAYKLYGKAYQQNGLEIASSWTRPHWTFTGSAGTYTPKIYLMPDVTYLFAKPQYEIGNQMTAFAESAAEVGERYYTKAEVYSKSELMMDDNSFAVKVLNTAKNYTDGEISSDRTRLAALELTANGLSSRVSDIQTSLASRPTITDMNSAISQSAESITTEVNKKVNTTTYESFVKQTATSLSSKVATNDFGTLITQNASNIRIAWNNISKYIQFENAQLNIYTKESGTYKMLISFNSGGIELYQGGNSIGHIGTSYYESDSSKRGTAFNLDKNGAYMTWSARTTSSGSYYYKLIYVQKAFSNYKSNTLYLGCPLDTYGYNLKSNGHAGITTSGTVYISADKSFSSLYGPYKIRNGIICED